MNMSATDILEIYRKNDATIAKKNKKQFLRYYFAFEFGMNYELCVF